MADDFLFPSRFIMPARRGEGTGGGGGGGDGREGLFAGNMFSLYFIDAILYL